MSYETIKLSHQRVVGAFILQYALYRPSRGNHLHVLYKSYSRHWSPEAEGCHEKTPNRRLCSKGLVKGFNFDICGNNIALRNGRLIFFLSSIEIVDIVCHFSYIVFFLACLVDFIAI